MIIFTCGAINDLVRVMACNWSSRTLKSYLALVGVCLIYFAMGPYLAIGNTGVYLSSYLIYRSKSEMKLEDSIWLLATGGFSSLILPIAGWLEGVIGVRAVCLIGGLAQSFGILATYYTLDMNFLLVTITFGGAYLFSLGFSYSSPIVNVCKWHPKHKGLVTGIGTAAMAIGPIVFIPLITQLVNPDNVAANELGLFEDDEILRRTKDSTLVQGFVCLILFLLGILLSFPAPDCEEEVQQEREQTENGVEKETSFSEEANSNVKRTTINCKSDESAKRVVIDPRLSSCSLEPKYAVRTIEFWILSLKMFITELVYIYLLFMYKPFGQTFIHDDHFLSTIGAGTAISNTVGRLTMGYFKDKFGYQAISIPLASTTLLSIFLMPLTQNLNKYFYGTMILLSVGSVGSQYALMPSAAQDCFGDKYASINIGLVYMSMLISTLVGTFFSHHFTSIIGWEGMIYVLAAFSTVDLLATLCLPSKPAERLLERYLQFYPAEADTVNELKTIEKVVGKE